MKDPSLWSRGPPEPPGAVAPSERIRNRCWFGSTWDMIPSLRVRELPTTGKPTMKTCCGWHVRIIKWINVSEMRAYPASRNLKRRFKRRNKGGPGRKPQEAIVVGHGMRDNRDAEPRIGWGVAEGLSKKVLPARRRKVVWAVYEHMSI